MKVVAFEISSLTMSFRKPRFENYQATYFLPPKSMVAGMIAHASNKGEKFFYEMLNDFKYSAVMLHAEGRFIDLWRAIQGKGEKGGERGIFYREKILKPKYRLYVSSNNYLEEIYQAISYPMNIVYLGLSEDLILIKNIVYGDFEESEKDYIYSMIPVSFSEIIEKIEWENTTLQLNFPPIEDSMVTSFTVNFSSKLREIRKPNKTIEIITACGGKFILKENKPVIKGVNQEYVYLI